MKSLFYLRLWLVLAILFPVTVSGQDWVNKMHDPNTNYFEVRDAFNDYYTNYVATYRQQNGTEPAKVPGYKIYKRWEWIVAPRVGTDGSRYNPAQAWNESVKYRQQLSSFNSGNWSLIGPTSPPSGVGSGRLNFVRIHPNNPDIIFTGSPAGGLWKSDDGGFNWTTNTDQLAQVIGCTDIAIDPSNTDIMYLATGDGDAGDTYTVGVLKTTDGGLSWNKTHKDPLKFFSVIGWYFTDVYVNPKDDEEIYGLGVRLAHSIDGGKTFSIIGGTVTRSTPSLANGFHLDQCEFPDRLFRFSRL